jgi:hypothetical protein
MSRAFALSHIAVVLAACGPAAEIPPAHPADERVPTAELNAPPVSSAEQVATLAHHSCPAPLETSQTVVDPEGRLSEAHCPRPMEYVRGDGISDARALGPIVTGAPLPDWNVDELFAFGCAYACATPGAEAHLLMWSIIEDSRPLRNHNAFMLVHDEAKDEPWSLVQMYRHATNRWWNIEVSFHSPARAILRFTDRPTADDVRAMLELNEWQWVDETYNNGEREVPGFAVKAGNVLDQVWLTALGAPPVAQFPTAVEFPRY